METLSTIMDQAKGAGSLAGDVRSHREEMMRRRAGKISPRAAMAANAKKIQADLANPSFGNETLAYQKPIGVPSQTSAQHGVRSMAGSRLNSLPATQFGGANPHIASGGLAAAKANQRLVNMDTLSTSGTTSGGVPFQRTMNPQTGKVSTTSPPMFGSQVPSHLSDMFENAGAVQYQKTPLEIAMEANNRFKSAEANANPGGLTAPRNRTRFQQAREVRQARKAVGRRMQTDRAQLAAARAGNGVVYDSNGNADQTATLAQAVFGRGPQVTGLQSGYTNAGPMQRATFSDTSGQALAAMTGREQAAQDAASRQAMIEQQYNSPAAQARADLYRAEAEKVNAETSLINNPQNQQIVANSRQLGEALQMSESSDPAIRAMGRQLVSEMYGQGSTQGGPGNGPVDVAGMNVVDAAQGTAIQGESLAAMFGEDPAGMSYADIVDEILERQNGDDSLTNSDLSQLQNYMRMRSRNDPDVRGTNRMFSTVQGNTVRKSVLEAIMEGEPLTREVIEEIRRQAAQQQQERARVVRTGVEPFRLGPKF